MPNHRLAYAGMSTRERWRYRRRQRHYRLYGSTPVVLVGGFPPEGAPGHQFSIQLNGEAPPDEGVERIWGKVINADWMTPHA